MVSSFAGLILSGGLLLSLPWAQTKGSVSFLDALFTSASAVCVTGLTVVNTGTEYTIFGQIIILLLIQSGGLGILTYAGLYAVFLGRRLSMRSQAALADAFVQREAADKMRRILFSIVGITFLIECVGAVLLFIFMPAGQSTPQAAFYAIFHAVSAFCNAGFSLYSDNLAGFHDRPLFLVVIMLLIVSGGIGHIVLVELSTLFSRLRAGVRASGHSHALSYQSRLAIGVSLLLIIGGCLGLLLLGKFATGDTVRPEIMDALFQSVSARTAGFNTIDIGRLPASALFFISILMFIGGSPGSCAGGIKTTSAAIWLARIKCRLLNRSDTVLLGLSVPVDIVRRVSVLVGMALLWNAAGILLLLASESAQPAARMENVIFEQISAFGTVGLSAGLTPLLSITGKIWIILTMFVGRLGPLTLAVWAVASAKNHISYPEGKVMIG